MKQYLTPEGTTLGLETVDAAEMMTLAKAAHIAGSAFKPSVLDLINTWELNTYGYPLLPEDHFQTKDGVYESMLQFDSSDSARWEETPTDQDNTAIFPNTNFSLTESLWSSKQPSGPGWQSEIPARVMPPVKLYPYSPARWVAEESAPYPTFVGDDGQNVLDFLSSGTEQFPLSDPWIKAQIKHMLDSAEVIVLDDSELDKSSR